MKTIAAVLALVLAACGGTDESATCAPVPTGTHEWSAAFFQYRPNAVCTYGGHVWRSRSFGRAEPGTNAQWEDLGVACPG